MGKIYCIMGKSSTGKDTIYKRLLCDQRLSFKTIVSYTTRPIREGEHEGVEYFFCDENQVKRLSEQNKIIELRAYDTIQGIWKYFTVDDGQIDLGKQDYLIIGTLESYLKIREYFGKERVVPIYIEVEDGERLMRAITRERQQARPKYEELCRRFLADAADFSEEKLKAAGVEKRFYNRTPEETEDEIKAYIVKNTRNGKGR